MRIFVTGLLLVMACEKKDTTPPVSSTTTQPVVKPKPQPVDPKAGSVIKQGLDGGTVSLRAAVTAITTADPMVVVLHWHNPDAYHYTTLAPDVINSLTFHIERPGQPTLSKKVAWAGTRPVSTPPSLAFTLSPGEPRTLRIPGVDDTGVTIPNASGPGTYRVRISGDLSPSQDGGDFDIGSVAIRVYKGSTLLPQRELLSRARARLQASAPDGQDLVSVEAGYLQLAGPGGTKTPLIVEDKAGNRVVRLGMQALRWGFDLHTYRFQPDGTFIEYKKEEIKTCVVEGTQIATPSGPVLVEDLAIGDSVLAHDTETGKSATSRVTAKRQHQASSFVQIGSLMTTPDHPVWIDGEWLAAGFAQPGSRIRTEHGVERAEVRMLSGSARPVYSLTVTAPHTYFAAGVLVHNKDRNYWPDIDDPWHFMWRGLDTAPPVPPRR